VEIEFWQQRWHQNQTGFHLDQVNPYLIEFWPSLNLQKNSQVFVPLCGKSLDMVWLANNSHSILGIECSEKAIGEFFQSQSLAPEVQSIENYQKHNSAAYNILRGDFFKLDKVLLSDVAAVYDRASLVALPEDMRQQYVDLLIKYLPESISILLVTIEYDQSKMSGPPFSISDDEVQRLYSGEFVIDKLYENDVIVEQPRFKERGLDYMIERVYKLTR